MPELIQLAKIVSVLALRVYLKGYSDGFSGRELENYDCPEYCEGHSDGVYDLIYGGVSDYHDTPDVSEDFAEFFAEV